VITVGEFHSGTARNIVASRATLKGSVRTQEPGLAEAIEAAVRRLLDGMKTGMRIDYEIEWKRLTPVLQQNEPTLARVLESARAVLGAGNVIELDQPSMGSEDFAWFAEEVPAAHLRIGSRIDGLETSIHHANYDCNEAAIGVGVRVLARAALELAGG
jgi:metal-dependent amidase/aminoacylase/carboxypeptidase family protein